MAAVYPTAVKNFSYRQDFTQLVNAADVNVAYDEITAVQRTLGTNPTQDTFNNRFTSDEFYSWTTVRDSIASARRGLTDPICFARIFNAFVPYQGDDGANPGTTPNFSDTVWDTHHMWPGGSSLVSPRDGVYTFEVYSEWQLESDPYDFEQSPFDTSGYVQLGLQFRNSGRYATGYNHATVQGTRYAPRGSCAATREWPEGTPINVDLMQRTKFGGMYCNVYLYVTYQRALP